MVVGLHLSHLFHLFHLAHVHVHFHLVAHLHLRLVKSQIMGRVRKKKKSNRRS